MADDQSQGEKTEEATPKKLRDAREKGKVSMSKDIVSTALMITIFGFFWAMFETSLARLKALMLLPSRIYTMNFFQAYKLMMSQFTLDIMHICIPLLGLVALTGVMAAFFQVGPIFATEPLKPDFKKLNPFEKVKQIFALKNFVEFIKSALKVFALMYVVYFVIKGLIDPLIKLPFLGIDGVLPLLEIILKRYVFLILIVYVFIAAADFFFQRWNFTKEMKMTKDEVKREYKEMEGSPEVKGKRKQLHREYVEENTMQNTKQSSVLVTNPTHYAIAIRYKEEETKLPMVMAKGEGYTALRMIEAAKEANIPIMRNVPLAHALYEQANIDQYIPSDLIDPIAEVLRWVRDLQQGAEEG
jgi:type III secretion protein U